MMEQVDLDEAVTYSRNLMLNPSSDMKFTGYDRGFWAASECIIGYLDKLQYNKSRALSVLSSGDHVFNLICDGVKEIDAFDINRLQYYVYFLKRAFILAFSYKQFLLATSTMSCTGFIEDKMCVVEAARPYLPLDVYLYYQELLEYALYHKDVNFSSLYFRGENFFVCNNYLANKANYDKLRSVLKSANVNLHFDDVRKIPKLVSGEYDIVLLSNIADYIEPFFLGGNIDDFKNYIADFMNITNPEGVVINYLFSLIDGTLVGKANISKSDFQPGTIFPITRFPFKRHGYYLERKPKY